MPYRARLNRRWPAPAEISVGPRPSSRTRRAVVTRRAVLQGAAGIACAALTPPSLAAVAGRSLATVQVAPGIHVRRGADAEASAVNAGAIANLSFVVGASAVAVFDPGGSMADGQRLRTRIREVTPLPIAYVVMSHVHPDHIFGAGAFLEDEPQFVGHARLPAALAQRGEYYRQRLEAVLGPGSAGPVVVPTRLVADQGRLDLGGRVLELRAHPVAHSDCDLSAFDAATATLLAGDLLFVRRVPSLDGSLRGWQSVLDELRRLPARRAVPGHGPVSVDWPAGAGDLARYLDVLLRETRSAVKRGVSIGEAAASVGGSERAKWTLFDEYQGHNVTRAFKELEWE